MGTYGRAPAAVGMSAIVKALDKVEARKEGRAFMREQPKRIEFKMAFTSPATDKAADLGRCRTNAYIAHSFRAEIEQG